jgi:hypothetical protein
VEEADSSDTCTLVDEFCGNSSFNYYTCTEYGVHGNYNVFVVLRLRVGEPGLANPSAKPAMPVTGGDV